MSIILITLTLVVAIIVGAVRKRNENKPIDDTTPTGENAEPVEKSPDPAIPGNTDELTDIPPVKPIEPQPENPEVKKPDIDVGEMTSNPEPEVKDGDIEYGTKERTR